MNILTDEYGEPRYIPILLLGVALLIGGWGVVNRIDYSTGERVGVINKVSKKGLIWETHEGQMALEGIVGGRVGANIWDFSVDRKSLHGENTQEVVNKLNEALNNQQKVKLKYSESLVPWPTRGSTTYYVQDVNPLENLQRKQ